MRQKAADGLAKINVASVVRDHYATLRNARTGRASPGDYIAMIGLPVALAGLVLLFELEFHGARVLASAVSVFAALLFGLLGSVLSMILGAAREARERGEGTDATRRQAFIVEQFGANVAYAVLIAITAAVIVAAVAIATPPNQNGIQVVPTPASAALTAVLAHLVFTLLMLLKRTVRILRAQVAVARTGRDPESRI